jgi:hypothetical protein
LTSKGSYFIALKKHRKREREKIFSFSAAMKSYRFYYVQKYISLLLSFDGRHLTHCSQGNIKNNTAGKYWERKLNRNGISFFIFFLILQTFL